MFHATAGGERHGFPTLAALLAQATPLRSGDQLAGLAAPSQARRVAAQMALADLPLRVFLTEAVVPYERDEVTRLIIDTHDAAAFAPVSHLTVGGLRDWLLSDVATTAALAALAPGLTPEMVAAVAKIMRVQDLMVVASRVQVTTRFRTTIGLPGRLSTRLQPNHPADDPRGIAASILDGLLLGAGDACIGINPATDSPERTRALLELLDDIRQRLAIPMQSCVLAHVTTTLGLVGRGAPVDLVFQSVAGTEAANRGFGIDLKLLDEAHAAARSLGRGENVMYFETGQGSALSANAHGGVDQQTCEARAYAVARRYRPLLVNTVVGFIGPEYLFDGKQITRAGLEDHFCGKLLGLPMGCDVCYTNHAEADQDDMDGLLTLLVAAGVTFVMGVPGADDVMLGYQSTSFHDALATRELLGRRPAPEFEAWLETQGLMAEGRVRPPPSLPPPMRALASPLPPREGPGVGDASTQVAGSLWPALRTLTAARIGLPRAGASLATAPLLDFRLAHAEARDAVHATFDEAALVAALPGPVRVVRSRAPDRQAYLLRPDLGRHLAEGAFDWLATEPGGCDLVIVLGDGLSATALQRQAAPLLAALLPALQAEGWSVAPLVLVHGARVAVGDEVARALGGSAVLVLIGERPGLTAPDSLGAYLTWAPGPATTDADRNCVSNIRPEGLPIAEAAHRLHQLLMRMRSLRVSGVVLKDESAILPALS